MTESVSVNDTGHVRVVGTSSAKVRIGPETTEVRQAQDKQRALDEEVGKLAPLEKTAKLAVKRNDESFFPFSRRLFFVFHVIYRVAHDLELFRARARLCSNLDPFSRLRPRSLEREIGAVEDRIRAFLEEQKSVKLSAARSEKVVEKARKVLAARQEASRAEDARVADVVEKASRFTRQQLGPAWDGSSRPEGYTRVLPASQLLAVY